MNARSEGVDDCMVRIAPAILLHSRHCTRQGLLLQSFCIPAIHGGQMCRCREAQDVRERPSMAVRCRRYESMDGGNAEGLSEQSLPWTRMNSPG